MNSETVRQLYEAIEHAYAALCFPMGKADKETAERELQRAMELIERDYGTTLEA